MALGRFQGALLGALIGDCLGGYWERMSWRGTHPLGKVKEQIEQSVAESKSGKAPVISYTDDSAMTIVMAQSLVECRKFDATDMAQRFTEEYFANPQRRYGGSVTNVFIALKNSKFTDVYVPASKQFNGEGSFGNGAAMRVTPAALFGWKDDSMLVQVATDSARITHFHPSAINGAVLQAMAVKAAMQTSTGSLKPLEFVDTLLEKIRPLEVKLDEETKEVSKNDEDGDSSVPPQPPTTGTTLAQEVKVRKFRGQPSYRTCLEQIRALLMQEDPPSADYVQELLGHGVAAAEAVPCAIYAFLHCSNQSFEELIPFSISLGGDADTIASMAGAIGGAYWGIEAIPTDWLDACEEVDTVRRLAGDLFELVMAA